MSKHAIKASREEEESMSKFCQHSIRLARVIVAVFALQKFETPNFDKQPKCRKEKHSN